jgi:hypothetical protein
METVPKARFTKNVRRKRRYKPLLDMTLLNPELDVPGDGFCSVERLNMELTFSGSSSSPGDSSG